jgi:hypothetical protein
MTRQRPDLVSLSHRSAGPTLQNHKIIFVGFLQSGYCDRLIYQGTAFVGTLQKDHEKVVPESGKRVYHGV